MSVKFKYWHEASAYLLAHPKARLVAWLPMFIIFEASTCAN